MVTYLYNLITIIQLLPESFRNAILMPFTPPRHALKQRPTYIEKTMVHGIWGWLHVDQPSVSVAIGRHRTRVFRRGKADGVPNELTIEETYRMHVDRE